MGVDMFLHTRTKSIYLVHVLAAEFRRASSWLALSRPLARVRSIIPSIFAGCAPCSCMISCSVCSRYVSGVSGGGRTSSHWYMSTTNILWSRTCAPATFWMYPSAVSVGQTFRTHAAGFCARPSVFAVRYRRNDRKRLRWRGKRRVERYALVARNARGGRRVFLLALPRQDRATIGSTAPASAPATRGAIRGPCFRRCRSPGPLCP